MADEFESRIMSIEIHGTTIKYAYQGDAKRAYEIRGVSPHDLAQLRSTIGKPKPMSSSATVQWLSQRYAASHFRSDGTPAEPCNTPPGHLLPMTPYAK